MSDSEHLVAAAEVLELCASLSKLEDAEASKRRRAVVALGSDALARKYFGVPVTDLLGALTPEELKICREAQDWLWKQWAARRGFRYGPFYDGYSATPRKRKPNDGRAHLARLKRKLASVKSGQASMSATDYPSRKQRSKA